MAVMGIYRESFGKAAKAKDLGTRVSNNNTDLCNHPNTHTSFLIALELNPHFFHASFNVYYSTMKMLTSS